MGGYPAMDADRAVPGAAADLADGDDRSVGVTLLIALPILGLVEWFKLLALFGLASLGIILRSVWNEWQEMEDWLGHEDPGRQ